MIGFSGDEIVRSSDNVQEIVAVGGQEIVPGGIHLLYYKPILRKND